MYLWRENSFTTIHGAPSWFLAYLALYLSVPVEPETKPGARFGRVYCKNEQWWGSLLVGNRVPAGLTQRVAALAEYYTSSGYPCPYAIVDRRQRPPEQYPWFTPMRAPRPYQDAIHTTIIERGIGVIDAPPRSGKTFMAARAIDVLAQPTIYLAPTQAIVDQTYKVFKGIFGDGMVSKLDGTVAKEDRNVDKSIVIATVQSAVKLPRTWWDTRKVLVIDEFHHAAADTYHLVNALAENVYYRLCFTGTHWRTGEDGMAMEAICSDVIAKLSIDQLVADKYLAEPFVCFVTFRAPPFAAPDWRAAYDEGIVRHAARNQLITSYADHLAAQGLSVIVLTQRREHADTLGSMIREARVAKGGEGVLTGATVRAFINREYPVLVGTGVLGEGVDVPIADAVIYAAGLGDSVQMMQSYFRPLTAHAGKAHGRIYDFRDLHHPTLQRQADERIALAWKYLGRWVRVIE